SLEYNEQTAQPKCVRPDRRIGLAVCSRPAFSGGPAAIQTVTKDCAGLQFRSNSHHTHGATSAQHRPLEPFLLQSGGFTLSLAPMVQFSAGRCPHAPRCNEANKRAWPESTGDGTTV